MKSFLGINQDTDRVGRSDSGFALDLQHAASGDPEAIRRLVVEFEPDLAGFARRRGIAEADSVVNAAFSDAFRNLPTFRGTDRRAFRAYLYRILRRRIADDQRSSYAQRANTLDIGSDGVSDLVDQSSSSFDERVVDRQLVDDMLGQLTNEQREVLEMRVLSGLSIRETANRTGRSEVAVKAMQRRALLSLRSVLVVMGCLALCGLAFVAVLDSRGLVTVIENEPAGIAPNGDQGVLENNDRGEPLVVEAPEEEPTPTSVSSGAVEAGDGDQGDPPSPPSSSEPQEPPPSSTTLPSTTSVPSSTVPISSAPTTSGQPSEPRFAIAPLPKSLTSTPCTVVTDGSPAVGEVAFVTYRFTGAFTLFDKTQIDIVGPGNSSALLSGVADPAAARNDDVFPFIVSSNMFWDSGFGVNTMLADGEIKTRCRIDDRPIVSPCVIKADGVPVKGDAAMVIYRPHGKYLSLKKQPTHILGWSKKSTLIGEDSVPFVDGSSSDFAVNNFMFKNGPFEARTAFEEAHVVCRMAGN